MMLDRPILASIHRQKNETAITDRDRSIQGDNLAIVKRTIGNRSNGLRICNVPVDENFCEQMRGQ
jgi:hypothetical protein